MGLVDPVADVGVLERAALHRGEVDLAGELAVDEDAEAVAGAELTFPLARAATHRERLAVIDESGVPAMRVGSHFVSQSRCGRAPRATREVAGDERSQHDPPAEQRSSGRALLERAEQQRDVAGPSGVSHAADAPHLARDAPSPPPISMP